MSLVFGYAARTARLSIAALLLAVGMLMVSGAASAQHTSMECPAQTGTVSAGGTVAINISDCAFSIAFAGIGVIDGGSFGTPDFEDHGTATTRITGGQWFLDYSHNGTTGIGSTDVFELSDGSVAGTGDVRFTITINASASPITVLPASLPTLTAGTPFSQTLTSAGGLAPYTYTLQSGALPLGLSLTSGGVLSGTPTQRGAYSFSVRSTDSTTPTAQFVDRGYTGTVQNPSLALVPGVVTAIQGAPFSQALSTAGGVAPHSYLPETGSFPAGISISSAGVVSGTTAAAPGNYLVTLRVTDASTGPGSYFELEPFTVTVSPPPTVAIAVAPASVSEDGATNLTYTVTRSLNLSSPTTVNITTGGTATSGTDYAGGVATVVIPAGATTATITINPNVDGIVEADETVILTVAAGTGYTVGTPSSATGTILNDDVPVTVNPATVPNGTVAAAYSQTLTASGGVAPYSFAVTAGALPAGLTLSPGGLLSGTPTAGGSFNLTVTATDSSPIPGPFAGSRAYTMVIAPPTISLPATPLAGGSLGAAYSAAITPASGGTAPYSYAVTAGALPGGLILNAATGAITGTPSALGTFNFSITAIDSSTGTGPYTATRAYSIVVVAVPPTASNSLLTVAYNAPATNVPLTLGGGAPTSLTIGTAPLRGTAIVTGTTITYQPTAGYAGPDSFTYTATNSGGTSAPATVTITVNDPVITITPSGGFAGTVGTPYTQTFTWNGGAQPWSGYQVTNLPAGLSITGTTANTVTVSGTPTQAGSFSLNASATDSSTGNGPFSFGQAFTLTVAGPTLALAPAGTTFAAPYDVAYSQSFTASGGIGPYTYARTGTLPPGLSFAGNTVSGTPTTPGSFSFTITATDTGATGTGSPFTVAQNYTIDVAAPTIVVNPATLPNPTAGAAYSQTLTATGGASPYGFTVSAGSLPSGLTLSTGGMLSGTSSQVGTFNFTVTATDANGQTGARAYTVTIAAPTLTLTPAAGTLTAAYGATYTQAFTAGGGIGPYTYALTGALPAGISFSGVALSGTPTAPGSFPVTVTATDTGTTGTGSPFTVAQNYTINVPAPTIVLNPATLPNGPVAAAYSQTLTASGGVGPYAFDVSVGALPPGLSLASSGALTGTPTATGSFSFTVRATDANGQTGTRAYTVVTTAPTVVLSPATLPNGVGNAAYTATFSASGGTAPYAFAVSAGALPNGLSLSAAGVLSGNPTAAGSFTFSVQATDSTGGTVATATNSYTVQIVAPTLTISTTLPQTVLLSTPLNIQLQTTGGLAPYSYAVTLGTLPSGLSLSASGLLTGVPNSTLASTFTITATDASGFTGTRVYTVAGLLPPPQFIPTQTPGGLLLMLLLMLGIGMLAIGRSPR